MTKIDPDNAPTYYSTSELVDEGEHGYDLYRNVSDDGTVYFNVIRTHTGREPYGGDEMSVRVVCSSRVDSDEPEDQVKRRAQQMQICYDNSIGEII